MSTAPDYQSSDDHVGRILAAVPPPGPDYVAQHSTDHTDPTVTGGPIEILDAQIARLEEVVEGLRDLRALLFHEAQAQAQPPT